MTTPTDRRPANPLARVLVAATQRLKALQLRSARDPQPEPPAAPAEKKGRVQHDDRGNAVWQFSEDPDASGMESASRILRKLDVTELKLDDTPKKLEIEPGRSRGYDPYGGRG